MKLLKLALITVYLFFVFIPTGDMNRDGKITVTDLSQLRMAVEKGEYHYRGDVYFDFRLDEKDIQVLRNRLAGLE